MSEATPPVPKRREWGQSAALLLAFALFVGLPNRYTVGGQFATTILGSLLGIAFVLSLVFRLIAHRKWTQWVMLASAGLLAVANLAAMARVIYLLAYSPQPIDPHRLLTSGFGIWVMNVILFAVVYQEMGEDFFSFPRSEKYPNRTPVFLDYLFLSFTAATAFSPTDMSPLTTEARMVMMIESAISLGTLAVVAARAVNILQ
ncbi:MAG TPA: hypothetical protein VK760_08035 [Candidatus Acidoferrales bacterium]|jgi:hypothetical protein|nr:hypothetical protein [Candidatus Acidoferrales bacterium]